MIPCGEDLGVNIECVPKTMDAHKILGLRVVRWCRKWSEAGQPYVPFEDYTPLSVTTTSVHDSSTLRQWWEDEKESAKAFILANPEAFGIETGEEDGPLFTAPKEEIEPKAEAERGSIKDSVAEDPTGESVKDSVIDRAALIEEILSDLSYVDLHNTKEDGTYIDICFNNYSSFCNIFFC